jgi:hypothetical protein
VLWRARLYREALAEDICEFGPIAILPAYNLLLIILVIAAGE